MILFLTVLLLFLLPIVFSIYVWYFWSVFHTAVICGFPIGIYYMISNLFTTKCIVQMIHSILDCCVFRPAFRCLHHLKAGRTTFFSCFQPFLKISNLFQWFHGWNQQKTSENEQKKCGFVYSSKLVDMQKLVDSLRGYFEIVLFNHSSLNFYFIIRM